MCKEDEENTKKTAYFHLSMRAQVFPITCSSVCIQVAFHPSDWKRSVKVLIILVPLVQNGVILPIFSRTEH